jgi:hypothetical protein
MIAMKQIAPHPSWNNPTPEDWRTGFSYVARVPPVAIGPQIAPTLLGQDEDTAKTIGFAGLALVALVGIGTLALGFYAAKQFAK